MNLGKTLFAQLMDFLPWKTFHRIVDRHDGDRYVKSMSCAEQFRVMAFAQLSYRESLRDIEVCLSAQSAKLYHMGFRQEIKRSTLADANEARDWRVHAAFAQHLIAQARKLYLGDSLGFELENTAYALDSTTIDLLSHNSAAPFVASLLAALPRRNEWVFSSPTAASGRLMEPRIGHTRPWLLPACPRFPCTVYGVPLAPWRNGLSARQVFRHKLWGTSRARPPRSTTAAVRLICCASGTLKSKYGFLNKPGSSSLRSIRSRDCEQLALEKNTNVCIIKP